MKQTQEKWVINMLLHNREITRNEALKNYISRLSGYILALKKKGWVIEGRYRKTAYGTDYVYYLPHGVEQPLKVEVYRVNGEEVARKIIPATA